MSGFRFLIAALTSATLFSETWAVPMITIFEGWYSAWEALDSMEGEANETSEAELGTGSTTSSELMSSSVSSSSGSDLDSNAEILSSCCMLIEESESLDSLTETELSETRFSAVSVTSLSIEYIDS